MSTVDFSGMTVEQKLELIGEIWDSIPSESAALGLSKEQMIELNRRLDALERGEAIKLPFDETLDRIVARHAR